MPPPFANLVRERPDRAARSFDAALKIDPNLTEARLRLARIRAPKDARAARHLEEIARAEGAPVLSYLAAMSRAEVSRERDDVPGAAGGYETARTLYPRSTAAAVALSSITASSPVPFEMLDPDDVYYTYPCTVLTTGVATALAERINGGVRR
jgi:hypothetical protein